MASGLLTGAWTRARHAALPEDDWRKHKNPLFQEPRFSGALAGVETIRGVAARHGVSPGAVALAWVLGNPAVTGAIVGARRAGQLTELVAAAGLELTSGERAELEAATA